MPYKENGAVHLSISAYFNFNPFMNSKDINFLSLALSCHN
jgi:hypothetical protein